MPLHEDDPTREGNLTDAEYQALTAARAAELGDAGLHVIPPDVLSRALLAAEGKAGP